ncbi:hypothetical protein L6Q21_02195 [Sandaracinobacter sp. RS1-74]|uniref:hypothetical protein n=1 Tax=Sandaracinobacteroides sayramensis TaxID=2913411 RepID=UPI001EDA88B4|nr:hypothetical protein [Sandaracinobacteroides sayramensis]MCG2839792.1 hypothetical protein [Sandaracinobacteroides sayramensis]
MLRLTSLSRPDRRLSEGARQRAAGLLGVALIHLALAILLLSLAPAVVRQKVAEMVMFSVDVAPEAPEPDEPETPIETPEPAESRPRPAPPTPPEPLDQPQPPPPERPRVEIPLDLPTPVPEATPPPATAPAPPAPMFGPPAPRRNAADTADTPRVEGSGPNGEPLYAAAWYREPYDDELKGYLSTARGPGWGLIACRTAPDYRVEDCVIVGEYPNGSGIARAVQAAAWQFKVRPPRIAGRYKVGEWVQIRIDYGTEPRRRG